jgi:hypothetical protein
MPIRKACNTGICAYSAEKRNVTSYLPLSEQANISTSKTLAYREFDCEAAKAKLIVIAAGLYHKLPKQRTA